ncbi:recombinase family protein [Rhodopseudomonas pseudopalustris]|uniref:recombinase family protein n=1 Tax=Rhodopseudomonas pseudopalustris TaxID=1513892 RepID=UPI003F9512C8
MSTAFDEYHSLRSAEDSINARRHLVKEGYWPGGVAPDGYKLIPAPNNSKRKVVTVDEERRSFVERSFDLALHGDNTGPPLGVKAIVKWLNVRGMTTRNGARWSIQSIHRMLTNSAYFGDYYWGVNPAPSEFREEQEPLLLKIPAIVTKGMFDDVQHMLDLRNPKKGNAKQVSSSLLLSGLAYCRECGAAMTLRTGNGNGGHYRYYYCCSAHRGKMVCGGPKIPEKELDNAVLEAVRSRVLAQDHVSGLVLGLQRRERVRAASASKELPGLQSRVSAAEASMEGLWASLRLAPSLEADPLFQRNVQRAAEELGLARTQLSEAAEACGGVVEVNAEDIARFRSLLIRLLDDENPARTKIYLTSIVEKVEVGTDEIRIHGHIDDLRKAVVNSTEGSGGIDTPPVRRYVRRWRRRRDSNPR